jgi:hypothetical protein
MVRLDHLLVPSYLSSEERVDIAVRELLKETYLTLTDEI